jgi:hypothetical protein
MGAIDHAACGDPPGKCGEDMIQIGVQTPSGGVLGGVLSVRVKPRGVLHFEHFAIMTNDHLQASGLVIVRPCLSLITRHQYPHQPGHSSTPHGSQAQS